MLSYINNKGFSLVEIIISIFILALLSGYVLEAFIVSEKLNNKAADLDAATFKCASLIEEFKSNPELILNKKYQKSGNNHWQSKFYYNENWENCEKLADWDYNISVNIEKDMDNIFTINIKANKKEKKNEEELIADLTAKKYLAIKAVE